MLTRARDFLSELDTPRAATLFDGHTAQADLTGSVGPYDIVRRLGRGGMGVVYLATDTRLGRSVALKLLAPHLGDDPVARQRFMEEARAACAIEHQHIAAIYDIDETSDGRMFIAMTFCEGETLRERIRHDPVGIDLGTRIAVQLAEALSAAHKRGIVHRDVKPGNIIVSDDGNTKLLDFGIASLTGVNSLRHGAAGTAAYMSPEQTRGEPANPAQDIWSFGATMYEALTGTRPFRARDGRDVVDAIRNDVPVPIRSVRPGIPEGLATLVDQCLSKLPSDRPANGASLLAGLNTSATSAAGRTRATRRIQYTTIVAAFVGVASFIAYSQRERVVEPARIPGAAIAILPFSATSDSALERLGRDLAITLSANLDEVGELRTIDAQTTLAQPEASQSLTTMTERRVLARRLGASRVLHGTLVRSGSNVRLDAALTDIVSGRVVARATMPSVPTDIAVLTDSLTWILLRQLTGDAREGRVNAGALMTRSVPALRAFLEGERLVSEGRWHQAPDAFARAFAVDSTFWLAYWRYAQARTYWGQPVAQHIRRAYADNRAELPLRERLQVELRLVDSVSQRLEGTRQLVARFPDYWPAWWDLVEQLVHHAPYLGTVRSEAAAAVDQLLLLNPKHAPAWEHRLWIALADRDTATARRVLDRLDRLNYDSASSAEGGLSVLPLYRYIANAGRRGGTPDVELARMAAAPLAGFTGRIPHDDFADGASAYGLHEANVELLRQIVRLDSVPKGIVAAARRGIALSFAARGAWPEALRAMHEYTQQVDGAVPALHAFRLAAFGEWLGVVDPGSADEYEAVLMRQRGVLPLNVQAELFWWQGVRATRRGNAAALAAARGSLQTMPYPFAAHLTRSLDAHRLALNGDTVRAAAEITRLERLRAQLRTMIGEENAHPYLAAVNRLGGSRWLVATGDTAGAAALLTWTDAVVPYAASVSHVNAVVAGYAYHERAVLEEARGRLDRAATLYERFVERVDQPPPAYRSRVEHARNIMARR